MENDELAHFKVTKPQNLEAEAAYRAAWERWKVEPSASRRLMLEREMDSLQSSIADSPKDPRWVNFRASLSGYEEFWSGWYERVRRLLPVV